MFRFDLFCIETNEQQNEEYSMDGEIIHLIVNKIRKHLSIYLTIVYQKKKKIYLTIDKTYDFSASRTQRNWENQGLLPVKLQKRRKLRLIVLRI